MIRRAIVHRAHDDVQERLARIVQVLLALALSAGVVLFVYHGWLALTFAYPLDYGEGPLLSFTLRLGQFQNIYTNSLAQAPYTMANYPPLFMLAQVPWAWAFGPAFWYGRAISLGGVLAAALGVGLTMHALTKDRLIALVSGSLVLTFPYVLYWSALARVDGLALGLSWLGLWVLVRWHTRWWSVAGAALLLTAAIYTRQTYLLAAPFAGFVWLWSQRSLRAAVTFGALLAGMTLGLFVALDTFTEGGFRLHIVTTNHGTLSFALLWNRFSEMRTHLPYLLACAAAFFVLALRTRTPSAWLIGAYLLGAASSALTVAKVGSNVNYFFELSAALSCAVGALIAGQDQHVRRRLALLALLLVQVAVMVGWSYTSYATFVPNRVSTRAEVARVLDVVTRARGPVLADYYNGLLPLAGLPITIEPAGMKQLAESGQWDQRLFVESIVQRRYALIILENTDAPRLMRERWTLPMLDALARSYTTAEVIGDATIYRPNRE